MRRLEAGRGARRVDVLEQNERLDGRGDEEVREPVVRQVRVAHVQDADRVVQRAGQRLDYTRLAGPGRPALRCGSFSRFCCGCGASYKLQRTTTTTTISTTSFIQVRAVTS